MAQETAKPPGKRRPKHVRDPLKDATPSRPRGARPDDREQVSPIEKDRSIEPPSARSTHVPHGAPPREDESPGGRDRTERRSRKSNEPAHELRELAQQLRVDSLRCSTMAGSGHPTSSLSAADLMAVLLRDHLRWDLSHPENPNNDHLIFSKGHASPLLYAMLKAAGVISDAELLSFRRFGSPLQGHPVPTLPGIDVATGSLGQGLPIGIGIALSGKYLEKLPYRVWVLLGDSEMSEGSIWEAFDHARHYELGNIIAILDMNRLGQRGQTPLGWDSAAYAARARAFGWRALEIDGHDPSAISGAYAEALRASDSPTLIVARTVKGKGVSLVEDKDGWHGKALDQAQCATAIEELGGVRSLVIKPQAPAPGEPAPRPTTELPRLPSYERSRSIATRKAYGDALEALGAARGDVVVLDGEVNNSTFAEEFAKAHPDRYFEMYISEQQMVAAAVGMSVRRWLPFASTFAAFLTRAYDFIRMAAVSRANIRLCGSHAGVSIGEDGPSQMGLEDLAMMRAVHGSTVLYPCCANQTARLVAAMAGQKGIVYLRTTRGKTPVLYDSTEAFPIGGSKVLREAPDDRVTIIAAGITVHEALKAHAELEASGISARIIDAYCIKPIDAAQIRAAVRSTAGNAVVVEDHRAEGGLGDAVLESLAGEEPVVARLVHLAVREMPGSGSPAELLHAAGIDADCIARAAKRLLSGSAGIHDMAASTLEPESSRGASNASSPTMSRIHRLGELGQSAWLDFIDHALLTSGELTRLIQRDGLRGLTSNPTIFQKSIAGSDDYDDLIVGAPPSDTEAAILERLMVRDLALACDQLRPIHDGAGGGDGFASIEVAPSLARDTTGSIEQARRLWDEVSRPNLMVKIPGTREGLPAIERCLAEGININITLLFSVSRYLEVVEAYLRALEARVTHGEPINRIASVASFFVSRVDTKIDTALDALQGSRQECGRGLRGQIAIANAKVAYEQFERIFAGERWERLASRGARPQRLLWGSTSPKDPRYPDLYYVEALVGARTVDTMTPECFRAYLDHGSPELRLPRDRERAHQLIDGLATLGIDLQEVTQNLEDEGVTSFAASFDKAIQSIAAKRRRLRAA